LVVVPVVGEAHDTKARGEWLVLVGAGTW